MTIDGEGLNPRFDGAFLILKVVDDNRKAVRS